MINRTTARKLATLAFASGLPLALCACDNPNIPESSETADAHGHTHADGDHEHAPADREPDYYTEIRGVVQALPSDANPDSMLEIRHEHIPNFKTKEGEINVGADGIPGMRSMTMPFPLADGASLEGIEVGEKVEFDFVVKWGQASGPAWEVTRIERLDAGTVINFENEVAEDFKQSADDAAQQAEDAMDDDGP